jgi:choline dehydrogenase
MISAVGDNPADAVAMVARDLNNASPSRDTTQGLFGLPFHGNETWGRFSARNLVLSTLGAKTPSGRPRYPLTLKTHSLATRVLFDKPPRGGRKPKAIGIEYLEGQAVYRADPRNDPSSTGTLRTARARREVILSAGVFNTPQLLLLSGIGPRAHLQQHNIPVVSDLPGVGSNLQDNPELPIVGLSPNGTDAFVTAPLPGDPTCTYGFPPDVPDPCVDAWRRGEGPYTRAGPNTNAFLLRTNHSTNGEVDVLVFSLANGAFRGFWPGDAVSNMPPDPPGTFGMSLVKMNVQSAAGTVKLRSADPRDTPVINFEVLHGAGGEADVEALADAAEWARGVYGRVAAPVGPMDTREPPCSGPLGGACRETDKNWVRQQAFGHHATSTCAIGTDGDPMAVLDSKFRVRGVRGLRVVDGSAFPRVPGAFPVLATFLISEKASEDVLGDANRGED